MGIHPEYNVENDKEVRAAVIAKFTKMVDEPKFGEQYRVIPKGLIYQVVSNLSKKEIFTLVMHPDQSVSASTTYHSIIVPGITPIRYGNIAANGFKFFRGDAAHICSKLREWAKIQAAQEKQKEAEASSEAMLRKRALEKLAQIK